MPETLPDWDIDGVEVVEDVSGDFTGEAYKFKTDEEVTLHENSDFRDTIETDVFFVSATTPPLGSAETMVFPGSDEQREPIDWGDLVATGRWDPEGAVERFADRYL